MTLHTNNHPISTNKETYRFGGQKQLYTVSCDRIRGEEDRVWISYPFAAVFDEQDNAEEVALELDLNSTVLSTQSATFSGET